MIPLESWIFSGRNAAGIPGLLAAFSPPRRAVGRPRCLRHPKEFNGSDSVAKLFPEAAYCRSNTIFTFSFVARAPPTSVSVFPSADTVNS